MIYQKNFHSFHQKEKERYKRLTKYQILSNILPFSDSAGISRRQYAFRNYAVTYEVEVMDSKSLDDSLFLAKRSIIDFFKDLLEERRGFKYILSVRVVLKKWDNVTNSYYIDTIYYNSDSITVINTRFNLAEAFETLKHRLSIYSDEGSGWIIDKIEDIWINVANYDPLAGSSYFPLPPEWSNSIKGLINLKNKDNECFKWCHIRFINPTNGHPERINEEDKEIGRGINFPMKARDYEIIEERFNTNVNVFGYENNIFPLYVSKTFNEQVLNVLLISNEEKSHYVFIKDFNRLMCSTVKTKNDHKKHFCMSCLQNFTTKEVLNNHRERCSLINETQAVKYETGIIKFKNHKKQKPIPFIIYADSEFLVKRTNISLSEYTKLYQKHIPNSIGAKLVCIDNKFASLTKIFTGSNCIKKFIE